MKKILLAICFLTSCVSAKKAVEKPIENTAVINKVYDDVFSSVTRSLALGSFSIKSSDKSSGIITAEKSIQRWDDKEILDCVLYPKGAPLNSAGGSATITIVFDKVSSTSTKVTVKFNASVVEPTMTFKGTSSGAQGEHTKCYSTGSLEKDIFSSAK